MRAAASSPPSEGFDAQGKLIELPLEASDPFIEPVGVGRDAAPPLPPMFLNWLKRDHLR